MDRSRLQLLEEVRRKGYLSLNKFAKLIDVSAPVAARMRDRDQVVVFPVGGINRVYLPEILRFLKEGNRDGKAGGNSPVDPATVANLLALLDDELKKRLEGKDKDKDDDSDTSRFRIT